MAPPVDEVAVVVCVLEARDISLPAGASRRRSYLQALAVLGDGRDSEPLHSEPIVFDEKNLYFGSELVWTMTKKSYQKLCSNKSKIKVSIVWLESEESDKSVCIGHIVFDLREASRLDGKAGVENDRSFSQAASWRRLIGTKVLPGKPAPHLNLSLCVDSAVQSLLEDTPTETDQLASDIPLDASGSSINDSRSKFTGMINLRPKLNEEKGYFQLGPVDQVGASIFYFNVFVCYARFLQSLHRVGDSPVRSKEMFRFAYSLFGVPILTREFSCLERPRIVAERASAKILSTPELLTKYFSEALPFRIYLETSSGIRIGFVTLEWKKFFCVSTDKLLRGDMIIYDGPLLVEKISHDSEPGPKRRRCSESGANDPTVGTRFSLGTEIDQGFATSQEPNGVLDRHRSDHSVLHTSYEGGDHHRQSRVSNIRLVELSNELIDVTDVTNASQSAADVNDGHPAASTSQPPTRDRPAAEPSTSKKMKLTKTIDSPAQNSSLSEANSAAKPKETPKNFDVEKATLELEEWKNKKRELFKQQLQNLELNHIQTLTTEWEKRHKERESQVQKERAELKKFMLVVKEQKAKDDSLFKAREQALDEREQKLQKVATDKDRKELKEFENSLRSLKIENGILKKELASLKAETANSKAEASSLKSEFNRIKSKNLSLKQENASLKKASFDVRKLEDQIGISEKSKEQFKMAWENSEKEIKSLRAKLEEARLAEINRAEAREKEYRSQLIAVNKVSYPTSKPTGVATGSNVSGPQNANQVVTSDVENNNRAPSDLDRLTKQREMLLKSGVYSLTDGIIRSLDKGIEEARKGQK